MLLKSAKSFCQAASKPLTLCEITSSSKIAQTGFSKRKVRKIVTDFLLLVFWLNFSSNVFFYENLE